MESGGVKQTGRQGDTTASESLSWSDTKENESRQTRVRQADMMIAEIMRGYIRRLRFKFTTGFDLNSNI